MSWGIEALTLGSLIILASGVLAISPSSERASLICCSGERNSGKFAMILPAREISAVSISTLALPMKAFTIGSKDLAASDFSHFNSVYL